MLRCTKECIEVDNLNYTDPYLDQFLVLWIKKYRMICSLPQEMCLDCCCYYHLSEWWGPIVLYGWVLHYYIAPYDISHVFLYVLFSSLSQFWLITISLSWRNSFSVMSCLFRLNWLCLFLLCQLWPVFVITGSGRSRSSNQQHVDPYFRRNFFPVLFLFMW